MKYANNNGVLKQTRIEKKETSNNTKKPLRIM